VVAVLDSRLVTKTYGSELRASLPDVPFTASLDEVRAFLAA
jgi:Rad3-related DNA helicase